MMQSKASRLRSETAARLHENFGQEVGSGEHIAWLDSGDQEFGRTEEDIAQHQGDNSYRRAKSSVWFFFGMAVLGVLLAFTWRRAPELWAALQPAITTQRSVSEEQLEINTLKQTITELRKSQEEMLAKIADLQATQRKLQQTAVYWYSEPNTLLHPNLVSARPATLLKEKSTITPSSERKNENMVRRDHSAPLPLVPARP